MNEKDSNKNKKPFGPQEFSEMYARLRHAQRMHDEIDKLDMIDKVVDFMGEDLPEAEYIIYRIKRRLKNDQNY